MADIVRIGIPDLISPSYFPMIAAVELGLLADEGVEGEIVLHYPVTDAAVALRDGDLDYLAGAAHAPLYAFDRWQGVKLVAALAQRTYWFLVARKDLNIARTDLSALAGCRIGAAPGVREALIALFIASGVDPSRAGIDVVAVPAAAGKNASFGVAAADALAAGSIDAFWANGMGAQVALDDGVGSVVVDARRDDTPGRHFTFPALATTDTMIGQRPDVVRSVLRAVVNAQNLLAREPEQATLAARRLFPDRERSLIAALVERDTPFYDPVMTPEAIAGLQSFARDAGLVAESAAFEDVVASGFSEELSRTAGLERS